MTRITIQMSEHLDRGERIWTDHVSYTPHGVKFYEQKKPLIEIFVPYSSIRMITTPVEEVI